MCERSKYINYKLMNFGFYTEGKLDFTGTKEEAAKHYGRPIEEISKWINRSTRYDKDNYRVGFRCANKED